MLNSFARCSARWARARTGRRWAWGGSDNSRNKSFGTQQPVPKKLDLPSLDNKWKEIWKSKAAKSLEGAGGESEDRKKMYILPMFPYPSGDLHLGHLRVYTISDVLARFRRMQGYDVVHPIGWDAFGLPAENAAIERGIDPASWTLSNIQKMKSQLEAMNGAWDWDREFATCDPAFYKHTQQLFLLLHEHGLAYQAESMVNYDPVDKTVLANEQVDTNGLSWRSGAKVEKRLLKQWFLKISEFREALLEDLKYLSKDGAWPERVLSMQKNWLGKSIGARVKFPTVAYNQETHGDIEVFTTRPDTLFGVQYLALASTHPIVKDLSKADIELQAFLETMPSLPPDSKVGYLLPNVRATNPIASNKGTPDAVKASLPIYVAPYVLGDYGDGAVMGVPGHDARDHAFWKHNRGDDPVRIVISPSPTGGTVAVRKEPFVAQGFLTSQSGPFAGESSSQASKKIIELLESKNMGSGAESWRLRDWLVSRQRYWGTPIPIIHCDSCGAVPVPEDQLPVVLPPVKSHWLKGKAGNPLEDAHDWVNTTCPKCNGPAKRDTDTMDTFVDSSWYFMRFIDPNNERMPFSSDIADNMLPVDIYIGGVEHAILHLLYARFISKFIATTELWKSENHGEPFKKVLTQGMVHGRTYSDPSNGRFLKPNEVNLDTPSTPIVIATGEPAHISFEKMSKSKYNGVDPGQCMKQYGADATRAHILFQAPVSEVLEWDEEKISGITRWLKRIYEHITMHSQLWTFMARNARHPLVPEMSVKMYLFKTAEGIEQMRKADLPSSMNVMDQVLDMNAMIDSTQKNFEAVIKLWQVVQTTISSVTESYGETYALNTVVSDLMTLTNAILDHKILLHQYAECRVHKEALEALIQMMAPITPAFAEECWQILNPNIQRRRLLTIKPDSFLDKVLSFFPQFSNRPRDPTTGKPLAVAIETSFRRKEDPPSIFSFPFPETDGSLPFLSTGTQSCAVQVNGKLKFVVTINIPPENLEGKDLEKWITKEISQTEEAKSRKMDGEWRKVIVVRRGKTVNFVK